MTGLGSVWSGQLGKYDAMTVNERLYTAGLAEEFQRTKLEGDLEEINAVLAKVGLWQDENGMNWPINDNAPNQ